MCLEMATFGRHRICIQHSHKCEPAGEAKSGQVKWFQASEEEMQTLMARNESDGCTLCECQAGTRYNYWY